MSAQTSKVSAEAPTRRQRAPVASDRWSRIADDRGWVMVPVMALLVIAIGLGFAGLALVDRQTSASADERQSDAAQTLAEGALNATATVLANDDGRGEWSRTASNGCTLVRGNLADAASSTAHPFVQALTAQVRASFDASTGSDGRLRSSYATRGARDTRWRVAICRTAPDPQTDAVPWSTSSTSDDVRSGPTGGTQGRRQLWVRAQADVPAAANEARRSRAVVARVQEDGGGFVPPREFGIGAGGFSTDVGAGLNGILQPLANDNPLLGSVLGDLLGTSENKIVATDTTATDAENRKGLMGVRCGVLNALDDLWTADLASLLDVNACLGGVLAGVDGLTDSLGLEPLLGGVLGVDPPFRNLKGLRMAPTGAIEGYRAAANTAIGVYRGADDQGTGAGDVRDYSRTIPGSVPSCLSDAEWTRLAAQPDLSQAVVFIEQVGDGEQYCAIDRPSKAKAFVVNRGGVVIRSTFTGLVYALNGNENISQSNPNNLQKPRELVRIEGPGQVTGAVWVDGVRGQIGTYPANADAAANTFTSGLQSSLNSLTGPVDETLCTLANSNGVLGPVVSLVSGVLTGVLDLVGALLPLGEQAQVQVLPASVTTAPTGPPPGNTEQACGLVKRALGLAGSTAVYNGTAVTENVPTQAWLRTRGCLIVCGQWSGWTKVSAAQGGTGSQPVALNAGLLDGVLGVNGLLTGLLSGVEDAFRNQPPAVQHRVSVIENARILLPDNAAFVPNTFRNLPPTADPGS